MSQADGTAQIGVARGIIRDMPQVLWNRGSALGEDIVARIEHTNADGIGGKSHRFFDPRRRLRFKFVQCGPSLRVSLHAFAKLPPDGAALGRELGTHHKFVHPFSPLPQIELKTFDLGFAQLLGQRNDAGERDDKSSASIPSAEKATIRACNRLARF